MSAPFLSLSNVTLVPVLSEWLFIVNFVYLDTSLTSHTVRNNFCRLIASDQFTHVGTVEYKSRKYLDWLILKSIRVRNLNLTLCEIRPLNSRLLNYFSRLRNLNLTMSYCNNLVSILKNHKGSISGLDLRESESLDDEAFESILPFMIDLCDIEITESLITKKSIARLIECCPHITSINIFSNKNLEGYASDLVDAYCHQLEYLCVDCGEVEINKIVRDCVKLKGLDVTGYEFTSDCFISGVCCSNLMSLKAGNCSDDIGISEKLVSNAFQQLCVLQRVDICGNEDISDVSLFAIAKYCPLVTELNVSHCPKVTDVGVSRIAEFCGKLQEIHFNECSLVTEVGLNSIFENSSEIKVISFRDTKILSLKNIVNFIRLNPQLEILSISDEEEDKNSFEFEMDVSCRRKLVLNVDCLVQSVLMDILAYSHNLKEIHLHSVSNYNNELLYFLMANCPMIDSITAICDDNHFDQHCLCGVVQHYSHQLVCFDFNLDFNDDIVLSIAPHLKNLTILGLRNATITDVGLNSLIESCSKVTCLCLEGSKLLSDASMLCALNIWGSNLNTLNIGYCVKFTDRVMKRIQTTCFHLSCLIITGCSTMSSQSSHVMNLVRNIESLVQVSYDDGHFVE